MIGELMIVDFQLKIGYDLKFEIFREPICIGHETSASAVTSSVVEKCVGFYSSNY